MMDNNVRLPRDGPCSKETYLKAASCHIDSPNHMAERPLHLSLVFLALRCSNDDVIIVFSLCAR